MTTIDNSELDSTTSVFYGSGGGGGAAAAAASDFLIPSNISFSP